MADIIKKLSSGWHLMRIIRTVIGLGALIEGVKAHDYAIGILGAFFLYQGITDTGCCSSVGCVMKPPQANGKNIQDIQHEEVK